MNNSAAHPNISIITCFFNEANFLEEAIKSVIDLEYQHWEYLLVDDGSTDGSSDIARKYAQRYPGKIYYLEHEGHLNKGLSFSRNYGMSKAVGNYLAFLDGDDIYLPARFDVAVRIMEENANVGLIIEATEYWYDWDDPLKENIIVPVGAEQGLYPPQALSLVLYPLGRGQAPCTSSFFLRRSAQQLIGGFEESFNKEYALYEDQAFLCKYYLEAWIYVSERSKSRYRQHSGSIVSTVKREGKYERVRRYYLKYLLDYMHRKKIRNSKVRKIIRKELLLLNPFIKRFLQAFKP